MPEKFAQFDIQEFLQSPAEMWKYLQACEKEDPGDGSLSRVALKDVKYAITAKIRSDSQFAQALRVEVATLFNIGESEIARRMLLVLIDVLRHHTARRFFTYRP